MLRKVVTFLVIACVLGFETHTFLQNTRSDGGAELDFVIPDGVDPEDPYTLLSETAAINAQIEALFVQIADYTAHFNNVTGPEAEDITEFNQELERARGDLDIFTTQLEALTNATKELTDAESAFTSQLSCLAKSECHPIPVTTTLGPAPGYNCSANPDALTKTVTGANQTGSFSFPIRYEFEAGCELTLTSKQINGLYYDFTVTDFAAYTSESSLTVNGVNGQNFTITEVGIYSNYTDWEYTIIPVGQLRFTLTYSTRDMCQNYDCANGHCIVDRTNNQQTCVCDGCYQLGPSKKCTIPKPSPCIYYGDACTGGTCAADDKCEYYCVCPGVDPECTTNKWCVAGDPTCNPPTKFGPIQPQKKWWYWF
uniref:CUB domain-containing protein n=1 Tax=Panagrellus redivivus TaxID=6233 RepID=A0A7E4VEW4_PANRE